MCTSGFVGVCFVSIFNFSHFRERASRPTESFYHHMIVLHIRWWCRYVSSLYIVEFSYTKNIHYTSKRCFMHICTYTHTQTCTSCGDLIISSRNDYLVWCSTLETLYRPYRNRMGFSRFGLFSLCHAQAHLL